MDLKRAHPDSLWTPPNRAATKPGMETNVRAILGEAVRQRRLELGYSQEGFAHLAGLSRTYYGRIERGQQNISLERLVHVAGYLETSVNALTEGLTADICYDFLVERGRS